MLMNANDVKAYDFSKFENCSQFYAAGSKLKWYEKEDKKTHLTVGFVERFDCIEQFEVKNFYTGETIETLQLDRICYNIYNEKYYLIRDLDIIQPDLNLFIDIFNFHYSKLKKYLLIDHYNKLNNRKDLYKEIEKLSVSMHCDFNFNKKHLNQIYSKRSIANTSSICIFPRYDKKLMAAITLRLPIRNNLMVRITAMPQSDGSYQYYFKDTSARAKGAYFLIDNIENFHDHLENLIFKNTYYYTAFKKEFGMTEKEDFNIDNFSIYEMIKY